MAALRVDISEDELNKQCGKVSCYIIVISSYQVQREWQRWKGGIHVDDFMAMCHQSTAAATLEYGKDAAGFLILTPTLILDS